MNAQYKSAFFEDYQMERLRTYLDRFEDQTKYTLDWWYLSRFETQHLFVYDGMKKSMKNNHLLEGGTLEAVAFTKDKFTVFKQQMNGLPIPRDKQFSTDPFLPLKGEIWNVTPKLFLELDKLRRNGYFFARKRVVLHVPCRFKQRGCVYHAEDVLIKEIKAWMYVATEAWDKLLDGGFEFGRVQHYNPNAAWNQPYYSYTGIDENFS